MGFICESHRLPRPLFSFSVAVLGVRCVGYQTKTRASGLVAVPRGVQSTGRDSLAISSGYRLRVSTSIIATKTTPTAAVATTAPPKMRAATMPTMLMGSDTRSRLVPSDILSMGLLAPVLQAWLGTV